MEGGGEAGGGRALLSEFYGKSLNITYNTQ